VKNEVLDRVNEQRNSLHKIKERKVKYIVEILLKNGLLKIR